MAIIQQYHKDTDTTYVYESESYWVPELGQSSQVLHARELHFIHPRTGEQIALSCPLPDYFREVLEKLEKTSDSALF